MEDHFFFVRYPISGYAFSGKIVKRVQARDDEHALEQIASWALKKFPYLAKSDVDKDVIIGELGEEPNEFSEKGITIAWVFQEPLEVVLGVGKE